MPWKGVLERLKLELPEVLSDRDGLAYRLVAKAMTAVFGPQNDGWRTDRRPARSGSGLTTWIVIDA
jgi:hypothetical protein